MDQLKIGAIKRFRGYEHVLPNVPQVFTPDAPIVIIAAEPDGVVRCALADYDGKPVQQVTDVLFAEELASECRCRPPTDLTRL